ncbi:UNKNOWN [Stylonychia lemnae]|uniref:Uncharacterized protein n=1 Tax=Stylonychia lemnae TaxID=5949 RepID=A0A078B5A1_STYLE|nr:UNKNOWN [Stylonychia lemnae]|eukprot:CDW89705.1 UNKNOWN [Stylonychia lemnae]
MQNILRRSARVSNNSSKSHRNSENPSTGSKNQQQLDSQEKIQAANISEITLLSTEEDLLRYQEQGYDIKEQLNDSHLYLLHKLDDLVILSGQKEDEDVRETQLETQEQIEQRRIFRPRQSIPNSKIRSLRSSQNQNPEDQGVLTRSQRASLSQKQSSQQQEQPLSSQSRQEVEVVVEDAQSEEEKKEQALEEEEKNQIVVFEVSDISSGSFLNQRQSQQQESSSLENSLSSRSRYNIINHLYNYQRHQMPENDEEFSLMEHPTRRQEREQEQRRRNEQEYREWRQQQREQNRLARERRRQQMEQNRLEREQQRMEYEQQQRDYWNNQNDSQEDEDGRARRRRRLNDSSALENRPPFSLHWNHPERMTLTRRNEEQEYYEIIEGQVRDRAATRNNRPRPWNDHKTRRQQEQEERKEEREEPPRRNPNQQVPPNPKKRKTRPNWK